MVAKMSRKWTSEMAIAGAVSQLGHGVLVGAVSQGNAGLGICSALDQHGCQRGEGHQSCGGDIAKCWDNGNKLKQARPHALTSCGQNHPA